MAFLSTKYTIYNSYTTYVAFEITPNEEWESVYANPIVTSWASEEVDLTSGKSKKIDYLYYITRFYISARNNQTIYIKFTSKNLESQMINIYEFQNRTSLDELRFTESSLYYNSKKKSYTEYYTVKDYSTNFVAFELMSNSYMKYVTVKASLDGDDTESGGKAYIAAIIVSIIFVICIGGLIIFFYMKKYRQNNSNLQNLTNQNTTQPLYPISQDIN